MSVKYTLFSVIIFCLLAAVSPINAQEGVIISLQSATTDLQTGRFYDVEILIDNVSELWLASLQIAYDPALLYIAGTRAGSPVERGSLFSDASINIRNQIARGQIYYDVSLLRPAAPITGSGIIGKFRIYPIAPGTTTLIFSRARLIKYDFVDSADGPVGTNPQDLPFLPALMNFTITGNPVDLPDESTATPPPTETSLPELDAPTNTPEPTLVNITLAPRTPTPNPSTPQAPPTDDSSSLLPIALAVMLASGIGLIGLGVIWLRSRRR